MLEMLRKTDKLTISTQITIIDNLIKENRELRKELRKELNKQTDLQSKGFIYIDPNTGEKKPVRFLEEAWSIIVNHPCEKCSIPCEINKGNFPWSEDHWTCPKCDSTYCI